MKKYNLKFDFFNTLEAAENAKNVVLDISKKTSKYLYNKNKNHISITDWESMDKKENKKIMWYYL